MSPNEAAEVLGVSPTAAVDEVQRAYEAKLAEAGTDVQRRDGVTAARDALLAASAWQAPTAQAPLAQAPSAQAPTAQTPTAQIPPAPLPPQAPSQHPGYGPAPTASPQYPNYGPAPAEAAPPPPYAPAGPAGPWYPASPPRRGLSTGAIVGITLGSIAVALVILVVAVAAIFGVAHESSRLAQSGSGSSAAPYGVPSDTPSPGGGDTSAQDYDVDGVHVHSVDGWTFELTADKTCTGAQVTASFSDSPDGDSLDQWSTTVDLEADVPFTLTIPDSASTHDYAGIETIDCTQT